MENGDFRFDPERRESNAGCEIWFERDRYHHPFRVAEGPAFWAELGCWDGMKMLSPVFQKLII